MSFESSYFKKKVPDFSRLETYGFRKTEQGWRYQSDLMAGELHVTIDIDAQGDVSGQVLDKDFGEPYDAFRSPRATGNYIGQVRESYGQLLTDIAQTCFQDRLFTWPQANRLMHYLTRTYGDQPDAPFEKYPDYLSSRVAGKWYALFFPLKGEKLGLPVPLANEVVDLVNIKVSPGEMENLLTKEGIYPSYHMSKKTWVSLILNDSLPDEELFDLVSNSRNLVAPKYLRQDQEPQYWIIPVNIKYYDISDEFAESDSILWTQKASMQAGDYVAIYITAPTKAVRYLCQVLEAHIPNDGYRAEASIKELMRIKPIVRFSDDYLTSDSLKDYGIKTVRGPRHMTKELVEVLLPHIPKAE